MKLVTGNRLDDGVVVYLTDSDVWTTQLDCAAHFSKDDADDVLQAALLRVREVAGAYLIDVEERTPAGRERLRETIRSDGPTISYLPNQQTGNGA